MPWTARANEYSLRLTHPINDKITGLCVGIDTLFNGFHSDQVFSKVLHGLFTQFFVVEVDSVFNVIGVQRLGVLVFCQLYSKSLAGVGWSAVVKFVVFFVICKRGELSNLKLGLWFKFQKWHKLLYRVKKLTGFGCDLLDPLPTCKYNLICS